MTQEHGAPDTHRTTVVVQPITATQEPVVVGWAAPAPPQLKPVPIIVTPPPVVIGWMAA